MEITSLQNPRIKQLVRLRDDRRERERAGVILVEGRDEIELAFAAGHAPQIVVSCPEFTTAPLSSDAGELLLVTRPVFERLSVRENPDGWLALFPAPHVGVGDLALGPSPLVVVAQSIEKPGNLGAILRTADAAAVGAVLVCDARVDSHSPNVIRASRGTIFSVPMVELSSPDALAFLRAHRIRILAATPSAALAYSQQDMRGPTAIAVGTEDEGLTPFWLEHADEQVSIPMLGKVNSLNVSIATALIVYEALRQRRA